MKSGGTDVPAMAPSTSISRNRRQPCDSMVHSGEPGHATESEMEGAMASPSVLARSGAALSCAAYSAAFLSAASARASAFASASVRGPGALRCFRRLILMRRSWRVSACMHLELEVLDAADDLALGGDAAGQCEDEAADGVDLVAMLARIEIGSDDAFDFAEFGAGGGDEDVAS